MTLVVVGALATVMMAKPAITIQRIETPTLGQERLASAQLSSDVEDSGGASIQFSTTKTLRPVPEGVNSEVPSYLTRDRDLGQVFVAENSGNVARLVLRVAPRDDAIGTDSEGANIFVQWFEVSGTGRLNDNRTKEGKVVSWTDDPRADDVIEGERYRSVGVYRGGIVPKLGPGDWFEIRFSSRSPKVGQGKRYGFLLGFEEPGPDRSLTLASLFWGRLGSGDSSVRLNHGLRREGSPRPDPLLYPEKVVPSPGMAKDSFPADYDRWWWRPSLPTNFAQRIKQAPGTFGRPECDTWRELAHVVVLRG